MNVFTNVWMYLVIKCENKMIKNQTMLLIKK